MSADSAVPGRVELLLPPTREELVGIFANPVVNGLIGLVLLLAGLFVGDHVLVPVVVIGLVVLGLAVALSVLEVRALKTRTLIVDDAGVTFVQPGSSTISVGWDDLDAVHVTKLRHVARRAVPWTEYLVDVVLPSLDDFLAAYPEAIAYQNISDGAFVLQLRAGRGTQRQAALEAALRGRPGYCGVRDLDDTPEPLANDVGSFWPWGKRKNAAD